MKVGADLARRGRSRFERIAFPAPAESGPGPEHVVKLLTFCMVLSPVFEAAFPANEKLPEYVF